MISHPDCPLFHPVSYRLYGYMPKLLSFFASTDRVCFLDSSDFSQGHHSRYSFLAFDPVENIDFSLDDQGETDVFQRLNQKLSAFYTENNPEVAPFQAGFMGWFTYEVGQVIETLPASKPLSDKPLMAVSGGIYDVVLVFDHHTQSAYFLSQGFPETDEELRYDRAINRLAKVHDYFLTLVSALEASEEETEDKIQTDPVPSLVWEWTSNFTQQAFETAVEQTKDFIRAGDIFQLNLTQQYTAVCPDGFHPAHYAQRLWPINPAPFSAFVQDGQGTTLVSSSPERFLAVSAQGQVQSRPIKGTVKRWLEDETADQKAIETLLNSEKDYAENVMIVDLVRNDISKVCIAGSVEVSTLCGLETFASVHHLVSVVEGQLQPEQTALSALKACFPAGSITGAPKKRAMELITELEKTQRGAYCGAIGYIGFNGTMDMNVPIRTVQFHDGKAFLSVGGGITLSSDATLEYEETCIKGKKLFDAFL